MGEVQESVAHDARPKSTEHVAKPDERASDAPGSQAIRLGDAIAQAKLTVGPAVDPYEVEADRMADNVVRRLRAGGSPSSVRGTGAPAASVQRIQRRATVGAAGGAVDADTERAIRSSRGGGTQLPSGIRRNMEGAFGADFSRVRVHDGPKATELSDRIQAKAFTVGNDIYFRDGVPSQSSAAGQHLLAHELTHTIQQGGAQQVRAQRIQRRGRLRRGGSLDMTAMAAAALEAAHVNLGASADGGDALGAAVSTAVDTQVGEATEQFAVTALSGKLVDQHVKQMAGVKGRRNKLQKVLRWGNKRRERERNENPMGRRAKLHAFRGRASNARGQVEQQELASRDAGPTGSASEEFERQTLMSNLEERSDTRWKTVNTGRKTKKDTVVPDGAETYTDEASGTTFFRRDKTASRRKHKAKYRAWRKRSKDKKRSKQDARAVALLVGKEEILNSDFFRDAMAAFGGAVDAGTRPPTEAIGENAVEQIDALYVSAESAVADAHEQHAAGRGEATSMMSAARAANTATAEIAKVIASANAAIQTTAERSGTAAIEQLLPPHAKAFQTKLYKASKAGGKHDTATKRRDRHLKKFTDSDRNEKYEHGRAKSNHQKAMDIRSSEDGAIGTALQDKIRERITGMSTGELQTYTKEAVQLGLEDNMHSALDAIVGIVAPDEDLNTLGASKSYSVSVSIPLPPPGKLELSFDLMAKRGYDGKVFVKGTVRVKGGVESATPGMSVKAMVGFGAYMEASSADSSRLGSLLSFALYRRFRESRVVMAKTTDYLWGKAASKGFNKGTWENKQQARHRYAKAWGSMVEETMEDGEYAETGGLLSGDVEAKFKGATDKHAVGAAFAAEYAGGTRYSKSIMENRRAGHAAKHAVNPELATGRGRERKIGAKHQKLDVKAKGSVGGYALQLGATFDWLGDGSKTSTDFKVMLAAKASISKGDFFGDPATYVAKLVEMAIGMASKTGGLIVGATNKLQENDPLGTAVSIAKDSAGIAASVGTPIAAIIKDGGKSAASDWAKSATKGLSVKNLGSANTKVAEAGQKAIDAGKNNFQQFADKAGAAVGVESSKSTNVTLKGTIQAGKPFVFEFIVDQSSSMGVNIMETVRGKMSSTTPILYLSVKDGKRDKFIALGIG